VIIFSNLSTYFKQVATLFVVFILVQPSFSAANAPTNLKALVYSETAAELQWNRVDGQKVQVSYNGSVVAAIDANSYFTDKLDPAVVHRYALRTSLADGSLSEPVEITFNTNGFTLPIREVRAEDSPGTSDTISPPALSDVRLLAYSSTVVELFWTRQGSAASIIEVVHNGVSQGFMDNRSLVFKGLESNRVHEFQVRPVTENGAQGEWFSVSVDLERFSGNVQEISAIRVAEQILEIVPPPPEPVVSRAAETETAEQSSEATAPAEVSSVAESISAVQVVAQTPVIDDSVRPSEPSAPILANDCVVRSVSDLRSCVDSAQGLERINIQSDLACTQSNCCPTGGALLRFNALANLTIEGNGHTLLRRGGQRQCSLLDITQSRNVTLNNWTLDDDESVAPCLVADKCPRMLHIRNSSNVTLNEVTVLNGKSYAIYVQQVNGFGFLNSTLANSGVLGLYVGHDDKASTNVRIQHSTFNDNQTNGLALLGVTGSSVNDNIVSDNIFRRNHWRGQWPVAARYGTGFTGGGQMYIAQASGLTVSGNLIEDGYCENCFVQQYHGSGVSGIELARPGQNSVRNTLVTNNSVNNHDAWGIFVNQGSSLDRTVVISNNSLSDNKSGIKPASTSAFGNTISNR